MAATRRRRIVSALVVVLVPAFVATAAAAPGSPTDGSGATAARSRTVLPPIDALFAQPQLATSSRVSRAKINIEVPVSNAIAGALFGPTKFEYFPPVTLVDGDGVYAASREMQPSRPDPLCRYGVGQLSSLVWTAQRTPSDRTKPGKIVGVGEFPPVRVSFPAFGSVPVEATLTLRQIMVSDGRVEPLGLRSIQSFRSVRKDDPRGFHGTAGCDAAWENALNFIYKFTAVDGRVQARISDIVLDDRPFPVGDGCRTATPVELRLRGLGLEGYARELSYGDVQDGGLLTQARNTGTGALGVHLYPDSRNLMIPPFTGCRSPAGEDVSRLISAFASGTENTLAVHQGAALVPVDPNDLVPCTPGDPLGTCLVPGFVSPPVPGR